ncbi:MAG: YihY/virulence factor BrkB family protein [Dokdonella sp.]
MLKALKVTLRTIKNVIKGFSDDELMTRAAALSFYSALSFAPLLVLLLWVVASMSISWQDQLVTQLNGMVGDQASEAVKLVIENANARPGFGSWAGLISLGVTLVGASAVFAQLQNALNRAWGVRPRAGRAVLGWLRSRAQAVGLLLSIAFLLIISFAASAGIAIFVHQGTWIARTVEAVLSFAIFAMVFAAMYKLLPDAIIEWFDAAVGAVLTALLFAVGKYGIGIYLDRAQVGGAYGSAAGVIVLLVWVYYSAIILLLGAELTQAVAEARGQPILPAAHAELINPPTFAADVPGEQASSDAPFAQSEPDQKPAGGFS